MAYLVGMGINHVGAWVCFHMGPSSISKGYNIYIFTWRRICESRNVPVNLTTTVAEPETQPRTTDIVSTCFLSIIIDSRRYVFLYSPLPVVWLPGNTRMVGRYLAGGRSGDLLRVPAPRCCNRVALRKFGCTPNDKETFLSSCWIQCQRTF